VDLMLNHAVSALSVPVTAVDVSENGGGSGSVMVVGAGNRLERRQVALGLETANRIEVRSGLRDGEMVVIGSRAGLQAGQQVTPKMTALTADK
jgi:hypothetical protein